MHFPKLLFYLLSRNKMGWASKDSKWFTFRKLSHLYRTYQSGRLLSTVTISLRHVFAFTSIFDGWVFMGVFMIIASCAEIICQNWHTNKTSYHFVQLFADANFSITTRLSAMKLFSTLHWLVLWAILKWMHSIRIFCPVWEITCSRITNFEHKSIKNA